MILIKRVHIITTHSYKICVSDVEYYPAVYVYVPQFASWLPDFTTSKFCHFISMPT